MSDYRAEPVEVVVSEMPEDPIKNSEFLQYISERHHTKNGGNACAHKHRTHYDDVYSHRIAQKSF